MKDITDLIGKTIVKVEFVECRADFYLSDSTLLRLEHHQYCCENVYIEKVFGNMADILDSPVLSATEFISLDNPSDTDVDLIYQDSFSWTTQEITTAKGSLKIRWYGQSNGYYSESVDCAWLDAITGDKIK
jgi:hypothetical protein